MLIKGRRVASSTGTDPEAIKDKLIRSYFHIPDAPKPGSKKKKPR